MAQPTAEDWERYNALREDSDRRNAIAWAKPEKTGKKVNPVVSGVVVLFFVGVVYTVLNPVVSHNIVNTVMAFTGK